MMSDIPSLPASNPLVQTATAKTGKKETDAAKNFEAVFIGQMTQMMMETVEQGDEFSGGHGEEMFRGVLAEKMGTAIANRGGIGIAPMVLDQIIKMQGNAR